MSNNYKALMAGFSAVVGLGGVAAYVGVMSDQEPLKSEVVEPAATTANKVPAAPVIVAVESAKVEPVKTAIAEDVSAPQVTKTEPAKSEEKKPEGTSGVIAPKFDILRVEANGSVLIAGKANGGASVEVLSGAQVLGTTTAEANGDFAIVIDKPLMAGDYQLVLRQTLSDGMSATSVETAVVSVPDNTDGQVLALVEEPGKASRIITAPQIAQVIADVSAAAPTVVPDSDPASGDQSKSQVIISTVETEGGKAFIAGSATNTSSIRIYANDVVLGEAKSEADDRFSFEVQKALPIGDYIIRAEALAPDGVTVLGRAIVPFTVSAPALDAVLPDTNVPSKVVETDKKPMAVVIRRGDTLWQISRRIYGRGIRFSTIYLANSEAMKDPNKIFPGQVFVIPGATTEGEAANTSEIEKRQVSE